MVGPNRVQPTAHPGVLTDRIFRRKRFFLSFTGGEPKMDFNNVEVVEIEKIATEIDGAVRELGDLELSLVGGGCGEVVFG